MKLPVSLPTNLSRNERLMAIAAALVIAVMGLDRLVMGPWLRHMQATRGEIRRLERLIRSDREIVRRKPQILGQAEAYREYLQTEGEPTLDMAAMLREIEALGSRSGIALGAVKPIRAEAEAAEGGEAPKASPALAIEVDYKGSMDQWIHFLYLLETSRSLFDIQRATVSRMEEGSNQLEGSLRVTTQAVVNPAAERSERSALRGSPAAATGGAS